MPAIIGFLTYQDFLDELLINRPAVVRVENSRRTIATSQPGMELMAAEVTASAQMTNGDVLVANFVVGKVYSIDEEQLRKIYRMAERGRKILADKLTGFGMDVRRGIISGSDESKTRAQAYGLWTLAELQQNGQG